MSSSAQNSPTLVLRVPRGLILGLLFFSALLNYIDRQALSILKPVIKADFGLTDKDYSYLVAAFMVPYIIMYVYSGRLVDRWGSRICMSLFVGLWSTATLATGFVKNVWQLAAARVCLGASEPGNFPAGIRTLSQLYAPGERGFAIGFFSAGSALGAIVAVPLINALALTFHWSAVFWILGALGFLWMIAWLKTFTPSREQEKVASSDTAPRWRGLLAQRQLWALVTARLVSDPVWYFYLFWLPGYYSETLRLSPTTIAAIGWIPFLAADLGGIGGCSLSDRLVRRGVSAPWARLTVMTALAAVAPLGILVPQLTHLPTLFVVLSLVGVVCLTWTFHSGPLIADLFPTQAVGVVVGLVGACGATGGLLFNLFIGQVVERFGYQPVFLVVGVLHPLAAAILWLTLRPRRQLATESVTG